MTTNDLTIVALAWNEAEHLPHCFASLKTLIARTGATTLVVFDPDGDARTLTVAREAANRVEVSPFVNFAAQRNRALDIAQTRWVFFIDPDERMTPALATEIELAIRVGDYAAYRVPRRNFLFGREVRHSGWYPDYQVRLLDRRLCRYDERQEVHEFPVTSGQIGTCAAPLIHFNYRTWGQFIKKQLDYADYQVRTLEKSGRRARPRSLVGQPLRELKRRLIDYEGYKDGLLGFMLAGAMSLYTFLLYVKLWRYQNRRK